MNRSNLKELHYITPIANIPSIIQRGILCKNKANSLNPTSIAMHEVQNLRANKAVPGGLAIHDYANLYFCARNPMMYKRASRHTEICVLRIDATVLDLKQVVIADANAASKYTAFYPSPAGLARIDESWVLQMTGPTATRLLNGGKQRQNAPKCWFRALSRRTKSLEHMSLVPNLSELSQVQVLARR